LKLRTPIRAF